jgi:HEAT repeat protein
LIKILQTPETSTPNDEHRQVAAKALAKIGDQKAVDALIEAIDLEAGTSADPRDKNSNRSNEAIAEALGNLGNKKACGRLVDLMKKSRFDYAVLKAIRALGQLQCGDAVPAIGEVALKHENKFMRKNAVMALGDIGDPSASEALIQMMFIEYQGVSFYREASFALFQLGPKVTEPLLATLEGKNDAVNQYFAARGGLKDTAIKAKCGVVLGDLRDPRASQPLIDAFKSAAETSDPVLLIYSAATLGALGEKAAVPLLAGQMLDLDASKRDPIMRALNQLGDRSVVPDMIKGMTAAHFVEQCVKLGLADKETCAADKASMFGAVKAAADHASNLAAAEHADAFKAAVDGTEDAALKGYLTERWARVEAAKECNVDAACWTKKLEQQDPLVRERAAWELGRLKDPSTIGALKKSLGDENTFVRSAAIAAYWSYGDESAVPEIEKRLVDEEGSATFVKVNEDLRRLLVHLKRA